LQQAALLSVEILEEPRSLWRNFTFCTIEPELRKNTASYIEIGQRFVAKVVFADRQTDRQTDRHRTDSEVSK